MPGVKWDTGTSEEAITSRPPSISLFFRSWFSECRAPIALVGKPFTSEISVTPPPYVRNVSVAQSPQRGMYKMYKRIKLNFVSWRGSLFPAMPANTLLAKATLTQGCCRTFRYGFSRQKVDKDRNRIRLL